MYIYYFAIFSLKHTNKQTQVRQTGRVIVSPLTLLLSFKEEAKGISTLLPCKMTPSRLQQIGSANQKSFTQKEFH